MARKNVSNRQYKTADGGKSVGPAPTGSVTYQLLKADGETTQKEFTLGADTPAAMLYMLAQFGFVTKVGNVANSVLNGTDPGTVEDAEADIVEFLAGLEKGVWREPGEGRARGPKYDKAILAFVLYEGRAADKRVGNFASVDSLMQALEDKSFYAKVRNNAGAMAAYYAELAKRQGDGDSAKPATVDDLT